MIYVNVNDATVYVRWIGKKRSTEGSWEYAFRGGVVDLPWRMMKILPKTMPSNLALVEISGIKSSHRKSVLRGKEHNRMQVETEIFRGASLASFLPSDIKLSCVGTAEN